MSKAGRTQLNVEAKRANTAATKQALPAIVTPSPQSFVGRLIVAKVE